MRVVWDSEMRYEERRKVLDLQTGGREDKGRCNDLQIPREKIMILRDPVFEI